MKTFKIFLFINTIFSAPTHLLSTDLVAKLCAEKIFKLGGDLLPSDNPFKIQLEEFYNRFDNSLLPQMVASYLVIALTQRSLDPKITFDFLVRLYKNLPFDDISFVSKYNFNLTEITAGHNSDIEVFLSKAGNNLNEMFNSVCNQKNPHLVHVFSVLFAFFAIRGIPDLVLFKNAIFGELVKLFFKKESRIFPVLDIPFPDSPAGEEILRFLEHKNKSVFYGGIPSMIHSEEMCYINVPCEAYYNDCILGPANKNVFDNYLDLIENMLQLKDRKEEYLEDVKFLVNGLFDESVLVLLEKKPCVFNDSRRERLAFNLCELLSQHDSYSISVLGYLQFLFKKYTDTCDRIRIYSPEEAVEYFILEIRANIIGYEIHKESTRTTIERSRYVIRSNSNSDKSNSRATFLRKWNSSKHVTYFLEMAELLTFFRVVPVFYLIDGLDRPNIDLLPVDSYSTLCTKALFFQEELRPKKPKGNLIFSFEIDDSELKISGFAKDSGSDHKKEDLTDRMLNLVNLYLALKDQSIDLSHHLTGMMLSLSKAFLSAELCTLQVLFLYADPDSRAALRGKMEEFVEYDNSYNPNLHPFLQIDCDTPLAPEESDSLGAYPKPLDSTTRSAQTCLSNASFEDWGALLCSTTFVSMMTILIGSLPTWIKSINLFCKSYNMAYLVSFVSIYIFFNIILKKFAKYNIIQQISSKLCDMQCFGINMRPIDKFTKTEYLISIISLTLIFILCLLCSSQWMQIFGIQAIILGIHLTTPFLLFIQLIKIFFPECIKQTKYENILILIIFLFFTFFNNTLLPLFKYFEIVGFLLNCILLLVSMIDLKSIEINFEWILYKIVYAICLLFFIIEYASLSSITLVFLLCILTMCLNMHTLSVALVGQVYLHELLPALPCDSRPVKITPPPYSEEKQQSSSMSSMIMVFLHNFFLMNLMATGGRSRASGDQLVDKDIIEIKLISYVKDLAESFIHDNDPAKIVMIHDAYKKHSLKPDLTKYEGKHKDIVCFASNLKDDEIALLKQLFRLQDIESQAALTISYLDEGKAPCDSYKFFCNLCEQFESISILYKEDASKLIDLLNRFSSEMRLSAQLKHLFLNLIYNHEIYTHDHIGSHMRKMRKRGEDCVLCPKNFYKLLKTILGLRKSEDFYAMAGPEDAKDEFVNAYAYGRLYPSLAFCKKTRHGYSGGIDLREACKAAMRVYRMYIQCFPNPVSKPTRLKLYLLDIESICLGRETHFSAFPLSDIGHISALKALKNLSKFPYACDEFFNFARNVAIDLNTFLNKALPSLFLILAVFNGPFADSRYTNMCCFRILKSYTDKILEISGLNTNQRLLVQSLLNDTNIVSIHWMHIILSYFFGTGSDSDIRLDSTLVDEGRISSNDLQYFYKLTTFICLYFLLSFIKNTGSIDQKSLSNVINRMDTLFADDPKLLIMKRILNIDYPTVESGNDIDDKIYKALDRCASAALLDCDCELKLIPYAQRVLSTYNLMYSEDIFDAPTFRNMTLLFVLSHIVKGDLSLIRFQVTNEDLVKYEEKFTLQEKSLLENEKRIERENYKQYMSIFRDRISSCEPKDRKIIMALAYRVSLYYSPYGSRELVDLISIFSSLEGTSYTKEAADLFFGPADLQTDILLRFMESDPFGTFTAAVSEVIKRVDCSIPES